MPERFGLPEGARPSPADVIRRLRDGNRRFVAGEASSPDHRSEVLRTAQAQHPFAVVLGCIDSRVAPELVFDQGVGDLFVVRVVGPVAGPDVIGSLEYAVVVAGAVVVVVLGHTDCGAVKGACDHVALGSLTHILEHLTPAVDAAPGDDRSSANAAFVEAVAVENVRRTVSEVVELSPSIGALVERGMATVVGAMHDVRTGKVTLL